MAGIGFIGSGGIASLHAGRLQKVRGAGFIANADINAEAAVAFQSRFGTKRYSTDYNDLLRDPKVEGVMVCLPTHLHADAVVAAARAGKAIFCEKPLASSLKDADRMLAAVRKAGVPMLVGMVRRYDNEWCKMRDVVREGTLGRPVIWRHPATGAGPGIPWFCMKCEGMGPLMDGAVHDYDFAYWTFGEADRAIGSLQRWRTDTDGYDTGNAIVRFVSGDEMLMSWSWGMVPGVRGFDTFDIIGPKGALALHCPADKLPDGFDGSRKGAMLLRTAKGEKVVTFTRNDMFLEQMKHWVKVVDGKEKPRVPGPEGRKGLEIALAIFESHERGAAVKIPPRR